MRGLPRVTDPRFVTAELVQIQVGLNLTLTPTLTLTQSSPSPLPHPHPSPSARPSPNPSPNPNQAADDVRPPKVLTTARGVYQGGALYYASLSLPHLGDFALTAKLGGEPIGYP